MNVAAPHNLTPDELAHRWDLEKRTLANWRCAGRGPAYLKIGSRIVYPIAEVEAYEAAHLVRTVA